jgi:predicted ATPase
MTPIERRQAGERANINKIAKALLTKIKEIGGTLSLAHTYDTWDDEAYTDINKVTDLRACVNQCDEEWLVVRDGQGENIFWVYLVFGNSPEEIVADWGGSKETFETYDPIVNTIMDAWQ